MIIQRTPKGCGYLVCMHAVKKPDAHDLTVSTKLVVPSDQLCPALTGSCQEQKTDMLAILKKGSCNIYAYNT